MRVRTAATPLMENSKEISVQNATKLTGNVLNVDSSSPLQCRRTHAHNAMRSAIFLTLLAIPLNAEAPDILIQGYSEKSIDILMIQSGRHPALFIRSMHLFKQAIYYSNGVQMNLHRIVDIGSVATSQNNRYRD